MNPGRITVTDTDGNRRELDELDREITFDDRETTIRFSDKPGSDRWIEATEDTIVRLGSWY